MQANSDSAYLHRLLLNISLHQPAALKKLHDLYCDKLYYLAFSIIKSKPVAEEIVSDVFIRIWEQREKLPEIRQVKWYLFVMTRNISLDYVRKTGGRTTIDLDEVQMNRFEIEATPEDILVTREMTRKINHAINDLPPKCRFVFKLVKEEGLKYREVAELMQISIKTVENQMGIALRKIHHAIGLHLSHQPRI